MFDYYISLFLKKQIFRKQDLYIFQLWSLIQFIYLLKLPNKFFNSINSTTKCARLN